MLCCGDVKKIKGDELELDIKKLNTKTLRHLQRYVQMVHDQYNKSIGRFQEDILYGVGEPLYSACMSCVCVCLYLVLNTEKINGIIFLFAFVFAARKRRRDNNGESTRPRKKRTSYTSEQKESMITFWTSHNWKSNCDADTLNQFATSVSVSVEQLKVFRQNNRKKYADLA